MATGTMQPYAIVTNGRDKPNPCFLKVGQLSIVLYDVHDLMLMRWQVVGPDVGLGDNASRVLRR